VTHARVASLVLAATVGAFFHPSTGSAWPEPVEGQQSAPAVTHEYAEVNGVRLHYAKAGAGPLMIFLHGFPEFWYEWKYQLAEFSKDHTVVAPDMRGYNLSSKPTELAAYQMPQLVEDVRALASQLLGDKSVVGSRSGPDSRFTLVAHDWGGVVAWVFAAQHPEMLDKLVIVNAPHPTIFGRELRENAAQQQASQYMLMFRAPQAEETLSANSYERLTTAVLGDGLKSGRLTPEDKAQYLAAWAQPGALTGGLNYYRASAIGPPRDSDAPAPLTAQPVMIRVPTLVIWGEKDTALLTGNLSGLDQYVPALTIARIPDGTHWVVREQPDEVNRLIGAYIKH
jgi:pimeloyl-ACP methyl ester carboxylesterase